MLVFLSNDEKNESERASQSATRQHFFLFFSFAVSFFLSLPSFVTRRISLRSGASDGRRENEVKTLLATGLRLRASSSDEGGNDKDGTSIIDGSGGNEIDDGDMPASSASLALALCLHQCPLQ